jgi:alanine racemase
VKSYKTFAEVDLKALSHNLGVVRKKTGSSNTLAVVKANAYGHGAVKISNHLIKKGVSKLGVAFTAEGIALRESGITCPILVFFDRENIRECIEYGLTPVVFDNAYAKKISSEARRLNIQISVHLKVDTGMGRVGIMANKALSEIAKIASLKNIRIEGLMSHFSDADLKDKTFAKKQINLFSALIHDFKKAKISFRYLHMANSAAVLDMPDSYFNMVRPGIMLYGYAYDNAKGLKPVLSLKSKIILIKTVPRGTPVSYGRTFITRRKSKIATIALGYADGYSRRLSNAGEVLISGKRASVAGRVCMDTTMIDITDIHGVNYNSEVVLIGSQGKERITAQDIAEKTGTIPYEVLTSIGQRVTRVYS